MRALLVALCLVVCVAAAPENKALQPTAAPSASDAKTSAPAPAPAQPKVADAKADSKPADAQAPAKPADAQAPAKPADAQAPAKPADTQAPAKPADASSDKAADAPDHTKELLPNGGEPDKGVTHMGNSAGNTTRPPADLNKVVGQSKESKPLRQVLVANHHSTCGCQSCPCGQPAPAITTVTTTAPQTSTPSFIEAVTRDCQKNDTTCQTNANETGATVLRPSNPSQGDKSKGETVLGSASSGAPKPAANNNSTQSVGTSKDGKPLFQVKIAQPDPCQCASPPCGCSKQSPSLLELMQQATAEEPSDLSAAVAKPADAKKNDTAPTATATATATSDKCKKEDTTCQTNANETGTTVLHPSNPSQGNKSKGETILGTATAAAPKPAANNGTQSIGTSKDGKPLYQVKIAQPDPCQCASPPCGCSASSTSLLQLLGAAEAEPAPATAQGCQKNDTTCQTNANETGATVLRPSNPSQGDKSKGETVLGSANSGAPKPAANNGTQSLGTSKDGKPLFQVKIAQPDPCQCASPPCGCSQAQPRFAENRVRRLLRLVKPQQSTKILANPKTDRVKGADENGNTEGDPKKAAKDAKKAVEKAEKEAAKAEGDVKNIAKKAAGEDVVKKTNTLDASKKTEAGSKTTTSTASSGGSGCSPDTAVYIKNTNVVQKVSSPCSAPKGGSEGSDSSEEASAAEGEKEEPKERPTPKKEEKQPKKEEKQPKKEEEKQPKKEEKENDNEAA